MPVVCMESTGYPSSIHFTWSVSQTPPEIFHAEQTANGRLHLCSFGPVTFHYTGMSQKLMRFSPGLWCTGDKVLSGLLEAYRQCSAKGLCLASHAGSHAMAMRQHEKVPRRNHRGGGKGKALALELKQYSRFTSQWISSTLQKIQEGSGTTPSINEYFWFRLSHTENESGILFLSNGV